MKYLFLVIALMAAVVLAALYVPLDDGEPLLQWDQVRDLASDPARLVEEKPLARNDASSPELYRWRDERGRWQYGDIPPPGVEAEPVEVKSTRTLSSESVRQGKGLQDSQNTQ